MSLTATMKVADIEALAGTIESQRAALEASLNQLAAQCVRADAFTGSAAEQYDAWLAQWNGCQVGMLRAMHEACQLLKGYSQSLSDLEDQVSRGFNL